MAGIVINAYPEMIATLLRHFTVSKQSSMASEFRK